MKLFLISVLSICFCSCGFEPQHTTNLNLNFQIQNSQSAAIIGGRESLQNEFPFIVNIWLNTPKDNYISHHCGGSLIHPKFVLTAAHCLLDDESENSTKPFKPETLILYISGLKTSGQDSQKLLAKRIYIHPDFSWPNNDVALIELTSEVTKIPIITISKEDFGNVFNPNPVATVAGWGLTDELGQKDPESLMNVAVPLIDRATCNQDPYVKQTGWKISDDMICANSSLNKKASCPGDSGGPLFLKKGDSFLQVGIVSWGSACRGQNSSQKAKTAQSSVEVYASVNHAYDWIKSIAK